MTGKDVQTAIIAESFLERLSYAFVFFLFIPQMIFYGRIQMFWNNIEVKETGGSNE